MGRLLKSAALALFALSAAVDGTALVLRRQGKTLVLRQTDSRAPWKVEPCPRPNAWDLKKSDCRQVSFKIPMSAVPLTVGVTFSPE